MTQDEKTIWAALFAAEYERYHAIAAGLNGGLTHRERVSFAVVGANNILEELRRTKSRGPLPSIDASIDLAAPKE